MHRPPCSPHERTRNLAWFPRMLDKIRLQAGGQLSAEYHPFLGKGFDGRCLNYLRIRYDALVHRVLEGDTNEEVLDWCMEQGRELSVEDIETWSDFIRKRGWRDAPEVLAGLEAAKRKGGFARRDDLKTYFDFDDADEGRIIEPHGVTQ